MYANALFASAIFCTSSFFFTAAHCPEYAAKSSSQSILCIGFHFFDLAAVIIHLHEKNIFLDGLTSIGT